MITPLNLLILEDQEDDVGLILLALRKSGLQVRQRAVQTEAAFVQALQEGPWDCILSDFNLPDFDGGRALASLRSQDGQTPFILVSGEIGDELAAGLMRQGANDFVRKDRLDRLAPAIQREVRDVAEHAERRRMEARIHEQENFFREALRSAQVGTYSADFLAGTWESSEVLDQIFGIGASHPKTIESWLELVHPEDRDFMRRHLEADVLGRKVGFDKQYRILRPADGQTRWVLGLGKVASDGSGRVVSMHGTIQDIDGRKRIEEHLRESEERFRIVSSTMMDIAYSCAMRQGDGLTIDWLIGGTQPLMGRTIEEVMAARCWGRFVVEEDMPVFNRNVAGLAPGASAACELRLRKMNGEITWIESHARCELAEAGTGHRIFGALVDITARKASEASLQEALLFNRLIVSSVQEGVVIYDRDLRYQVWNPSMERISGLTAQEVLGRHPLEVFPFLRDTKVLEGLGKALEGEATPPIDIPYRVPATGHSGWTTHANAPFRNSRGEIIGVIATISDISNRKAQEFELQRVNRLYNLLSQLGQCLVRVETREHLLKEFCAIAVKTGGYPLVWVAWLDPETGRALPIASAGDCLAYLDRLSVRTDLSPEGQGPTGMALRENRIIVCQDIPGTAYMGPWQERAECNGLRSVAAFPIHIRGQVVGAFMVYAGTTHAFLDQEVKLLAKAAADISYGLAAFLSKRENAELQAQLQQIQKMESLGTLAGGIAHDMNNVLGAILGLASANLLVQPEGGSTYNAFETIARAATRGGQMVRSLLTIARQNQPVESDVSLNLIIKEVVGLLERTTLAKVHLELDLAEGLPSIPGDAGALTNAIVNLCVNAVDAMPESGTLGLQSLDLRDGWVELRVKDTGTGMSKEVLSRAMEPFFTTKDQGKGTGLGLAMVYSTVQAHHGQVHIQSELGKGTCVVIRIPAGVSPPDLRGKPADGSAQAASQSLRILVVDDDELVQDSMVNLLRIMGHAATLASRGEEALDLLEAGLAPHLVILDRNMPGLDGLGTLQRLRLRWPDLPVLIATGNADQAVMDLVASDPETHLLNKPFDNKDLSLVLGQWAGLLGA